MKNLSHKEQIENMMARPIPRKRVSLIRMQVVKESRALYGMKRFTSPEMAVEMVRPIVDHADREMLLVLTLDNLNTPLGIEIAAVGGMNVTYVDVKSLFKFALLNNAAGIVLFHNHPSGDAEASQEDIKVTERIQQAAGILGLRLLDHIIIGDEGSFHSLREEGVITFLDDESESVAEGGRYL